MKTSTIYFNNGATKVTSFDGTETWYDSNHKIHKADGPAIVVLYYDFDRDPNSETYLERKIFIKNEWFWRGKKIDASNQEQFNKLVNLKAFW